VNEELAPAASDTAGAEDRFWVLYAASLPYVYGFLVRRCDRQTAEDLTPDSMHVLDPVTLAEVGTLPVTANQGDVTIAADGSVWLVRNQTGEVVHITPRML
jgi:hypothetical protein